MNIIIIIRESNINDRVRLSKTLDFFNENGYNLELWKKRGEQDVSYKEVVISDTKKSKAVEYLLWTINLFFKVLLKKTKGLIYVSGFESAFIVYLTSFVTGNKFVFDNPDNFYQSKKMPLLLRKTILFIEKQIIKKSNVTVVPDHLRISGYSLNSDKFVIVKNFPSRLDVQKAKALQFAKNNTLVIYINGWLMPTRGLKMITEFIKLLDERLDIKIKIAGKKDGLGTILDSKFVEYFGVVDSVTSLGHYHTSDLVFTFYDPSIEINRNASPNKWGDALVTGTIPVLNNGIETVNLYFPKGGYFSVNYGDAKSLHELVMSVYNDKSILTNKFIDFNKNPKYFWEDQMLKILSQDYA